MASISEIRARYPQYDDMSDEDLARALHGKYYSDMPYEDFTAKIGLGQGPTDAGAQPQGFQVAPYEKGVSGLGLAQNIGADAYNTAAGIGGGVYDAGYKLITDAGGAAQDVANFAGNTGALIGGAGMHGLKAILPDQAFQTIMEHERNPAETKQAMDLAGNVGGYLKDKYWDNLGKTLYEHPVQSAMDVASLAYGGQAALPKAMVGAKRALGTVAEVTNPLNAIAKPIQAARGAVLERSALKQMRDTAPSHDEVIALKNAKYTALDNAGIKFDANTYAQMMQSIAGKLRTFDKEFAPMTRGLAESRMMNFYGKSPSFRDVEDMLIISKRILREPSALQADKAAAHIVLEELNDFFEKAPVMSNGSIPADQIAEAAKEARDLARRHILAREAGEIERKSKWYLGGEESGKRNQMSSFGKRNEKSLTETENKAALKVVKREGLHGLLTTGGSRLVQAMLAGGLGVGAGTAGLGIIPALGVTAAVGGANLGARAASAAMTNRKLDQFRKTVLAGREAQQKALLGSKRLPIKTKGLLLGTEGAGLLTGRQ
jgi:hypothetical protein